MILGSNYDGPIYDLLNDNSCERKVVDLCTGAGHWYVVYPSLLFQTLSSCRVQYTDRGLSCR